MLTDPVRNYVSRSWPNPGTRGEQVRSMYDRLKEALSKEALAKAESATLPSNDASASGEGGKSTGPTNGQASASR